jgi:hypothetical protein
MFQIERPVLNARAGYYEAVEVDGWEEKPAATLIREVIPETRAAAD